MITDPIADFLTIIRNGYLAGKSSVIVPRSKVKENIAKILKTEEYIKDFEVNPKELVIGLLYLDKKPAITGIKRISKPGLRIYRGKDEVSQFKRGIGVSLISTSKGIMTDIDARYQSVGGEVICHVW